MSKKVEKHPAVNEADLPLGMGNYKLLLIGLGIIILGFLLMIGSNNIYDFRKTILSPILVVGGFLFEIYAIMKKTKD